MADESYMEQIFMNLYRITDELQSRGRKYSYLIVREEGNLLLICRRALVSNHFEKIDQLGGVETQFVYHSHDAPGTHIDEVHSRFGSKLYYHQAEREEIREKTQCPGVEFGDEGLQLGSDFHALFFPGHTPGHTIFRWQSGGKHYWFTSHVVGRNGAKWDVGFNPAKAAPRLTPQFQNLAELPIDYAFPTQSKCGQEEFHRFSEYTRKTFAKTLREKFTPITPSKKK